MCCPLVAVICFPLLGPLHYQLTFWIGTKVAQYQSYEHQNNLVPKQWVPKKFSTQMAMPIYWCQIVSFLYSCIHTTQSIFLFLCADIYACISVCIWVHSSNFWTNSHMYVWVGRFSNFSKIFLSYWFAYDLLTHITSLVICSPLSFPKIRLTQRFFFFEYLRQSSIKVKFCRSSGYSYCKGLSNIFWL